MHEYRTHTCNQLRATDIGTRVRISGWINNRRDHGGILFIDLRDNYGITQVLIPAEAAFQNEVAALPKESVVRFEGTVRARPPESVNPRLDTGEIELQAESCLLLGRARPLPFNVFPEDEAPEEMRLKYRYLDLRRSVLHRNIMMRSRIIASVRDRMRKLGFNEFQTPILTCSSPEGARDFLVPSRLHPGQFFALPQAPQQFKQLLMIAGFDRYFQIAPCFRDEDARADRSPGEFYQLDVEMSFVTQEDVFAVMEELFVGLFQEFSSDAVTAAPFPRIPYAEAMRKYGTDKPDLRNPLEIVDVSELFQKSSFRAFQGKIVRVLPVPGTAEMSRSFFDNLEEFAKSHGAPGLAWLRVEEGGVLKGPIAKFLSESESRQLIDRSQARTGTALFFAANAKAAEVCKILNALRTKLGSQLDLLEKNAFRFCWIVDFPMFERNEETHKIEFSHNPFSMPQGGLEALETQDPLTLKAYQYDIVCNGYELSSGAIRNHEPEIMYKAFEIAGYPRTDVDEKFGAMVTAFGFGAPPHGGIAPGIDRIVMLLAGEQNLREVIAFPMNQKAQDLMMNAPSSVSEAQLRELWIRLALPEGAAED